MHPADEPRCQPQIAQPRQRIGHRPTRCLNPVFHRAIQQLAALLFHQLHDALFDAHQLQKTVIGGAEHVNDGIADADNLIRFHVFSSYGHRSRIGHAPQRGLRAVQI